MQDAREVNHFRIAEEKLADARERVARQRELIARMVERGHDVIMAESVLVTMRETLAAMEKHYLIIVRELQEKGRAAPSARDIRTEA